MKSVVICGSRRFRSEIRQFSEDLKDLKVPVYEPYLHSGPEEWVNLSEVEKKFVALGLTHDHFYKIQLADVVFIFNKDGYIGNSTTLEIGYSVALGKPVYALHDDEKELFRHVIFRDIITSPDKLVQMLE